MDRIGPVELLRRQYLQLIDPEQLTFPSNELLRLPDIQAQTFRSMFDDSAVPFAPPERYKFRVLKRLVNALEEAIVDPEEDVRFSFPTRFLFMTCCPVLYPSLSHINFSLD